MIIHRNVGGVAPMIDMMDPVVSAHGRWRRFVGLVVVGVVCTVLWNPAAGVVAAALVGLIPLVSCRMRDKRQHTRLAPEIAAVFELAARSVRAGMAVDDALSEAVERTGGPAAAVIQSLCRTRRGTPAASVLPMYDERSRAMTAPTGRPDDRVAAVVVAVLDMVEGTAGGGARGLEAGAQLLREQERARAEVTAGASHARASATLLIVIPVVFAGVALVVVPGVAATSAFRPVVVASVAAGVLFELVGALWTRRMVQAVHGDLQ